MQTAVVRWASEQKFLAMSPSGHAIPVDSDRESNKAPGPMELVLMALGACTATDMVVVLRKKRQKLESLEVSCSGEDYRCRRVRSTESADQRRPGKDGGNQRRVDSHAHGHS